MSIQGFQEFLTEAGVKTERQETAFVVAITAGVEANLGKPIKLITNKGETLKGVVGAAKFKGRQQSGSEPYTDVQIFTGSGVKNVSMKGPSAPSLAGGGLRGVETLLPGLGARYIRKVYKHLTKKLKLKAFVVKNSAGDVVGVVDLFDEK